MRARVLRAFAAKALSARVECGFIRKGENTSVAASRLQVAPSAAVCCVIGCGDRSQRAQTLERLLYEKKLAPRRALYDEGARPARTASLA